MPATDALDLGVVAVRSRCGTEAQVKCVLCRRIERVELAGPADDAARVNALRAEGWRLIPVEIEQLPVVGAVCGACAKGIESGNEPAELPPT